MAGGSSGVSLSEEVEVITDPSSLIFHFISLIIQKISYLLYGDRSFNILDSVLGIVHDHIYLLYFGWQTHFASFRIWHIASNSLNLIF